jgi:hypothetical protein
MTTIDTAAIPDNMILSNRDKAQHTEERGLDSKAVQTEQYRDHAANRRIEDEDLPDIRTAADDAEDQA